ncbi:MAG TPA: hypothetical protein VN908_08695 [Gemmatimonadales bacterium]|nr:hypothetical protein [Gemmatimonadales bacterium]
MNSRLGGLTVSALATLLLFYPPNRLDAQHFAIGPQVVFGDYREVTANLHYRGGGLGAAATVTWKKFSADVAASKIKYKPEKDGTATREFDASEFDVRLRYYISGPVSAEVGFVNRKADPEFEAQSVGAVAAGARMAYLLGPGVRMGLYGGLLFGPKFSGGGTASALGGALELGLGMTVDALRGRLRFTGDYDFQRITRKTNDGSGAVNVPIQQSLGRVGIAVAF